MKIKTEQLSSHLRSQLSPCYLVTGDEHLLVNEALDAIRDAARGRGFGLRDLHVAATGFDWSTLRDAGSNLSLFADRRIVELRLPTGKPGKAGGEAIAELAGLAGSDLLFLVSAPRLERNAQSARWVKALDSHGVSVTVWPVTVRDLPGWIAARMRKAGLAPDREAVTMIAERIEGNLLAAAQEIEKLRLLLGEGRVTAADVGRAVADSSRFDVFKLVDAALGGDARRALRILQGLRGEGVEPVVVAWALTRELRTLAALAEAVAAGKDLGAAMRPLHVWQSRQALLRSCIGRHAPAQFRQLLKRVWVTEQAAKGQRLDDPWQLATDILIALATGSRKAA